jgi:hypothetical protein
MLILTLAMLREAWPVSASDASYSDDDPNTSEAPVAIEITLKARIVDQPRKLDRPLEIEDVGI